MLSSLYLGYILEAQLWDRRYGHGYNLIIDFRSTSNFVSPSSTKILKVFSIKLSGNHFSLLLIFICNPASLHYEQLQRFIYVRGFDSLKFDIQFNDLTKEKCKRQTNIIVT